jgi:hypothetical protein
MKVVYIAGKFRANTSWGVEQNVRKAEDWGLKVAALGLVPLIPHSMFRYYDGQQTANYWLQATLELMRRCDAILLTPGWGSSEGSLGEKAEAERLKMPVFETSPPGWDALAEFADRALAGGYPAMIRGCVLQWTRPGQKKQRRRLRPNGGGSAR